MCSPHDRVVTLSSPLPSGIIGVAHLPLLALLLMCEARLLVAFVPGTPLLSRLGKRAATSLSSSHASRHQSCLPASLGPNARPRVALPGLRCSADSDWRAEEPVVIVGAGVAGMSCAIQLAEKGIPVRIVEASDGVGGRVRTDIVDGFLCDRGFQIFLTSYPGFAPSREQTHAVDNSDDGAPASTHHHNRSPPYPSNTAKR